MAREIFTRGFTPRYLCRTFSAYPLFVNKTGIMYIMLSGASRFRQSTTKATQTPPKPTIFIPLRLFFQNSKNAIHTPHKINHITTVIHTTFFYGGTLSVPSWYAFRTTMDFQFAQIPFVFHLCALNYHLIAPYYEREEQTNCKAL